MKMKLLNDYNEHNHKGKELEVDKILFDEAFAGKFKVRVIGIEKRPTYLAITWFVKTPVKYWFS